MSSKDFLNSQYSDTPRVITSLIVILGVFGGIGYHYYKKDAHRTDCLHGDQAACQALIGDGVDPALYKSNQAYKEEMDDNSNMGAMDLYGVTQVFVTDNNSGHVKPSIKLSKAYVDYWDKWFTNSLSHPGSVR